MVNSQNDWYPGSLIALTWAQWLPMIDAWHAFARIIDALSRTRAELGRYKIESELGAGGMSVVYRAQDPKLQRPVAIKVMHDYLAQNQDAKTRFHREALAVAQLQHPHIIKVLDYAGEDTDKLYIVMELVEGTSLCCSDSKSGSLLASRICPFACSPYCRRSSSCSHCRDYPSRSKA